MRYEIDDSSKSLAQMFESYRVDELKVVVKCLKQTSEQMNIIPESLFQSSFWNENPTRKAELVDWIVKCIHDAKFLQALYKSMTSLEKAAVQEVVHSWDGEYSWPRFEAKYGAAPEFSMYNKSKYRTDKYLALSFIMPTSKFMPGEILAIMKEFVPEPQKTTAKYQSELPEKIDLYGEQGETLLVQHNTEQAALNDLMAILQLVNAGKIGVSSRTGKVTKGGAKAIREVLSHGDFYPGDVEASSKYDVQIGQLGIRPFAWVMTLQAGNLVKTNGAKLELTRTGQSALKKPSQDILKRLWERWLKNKLLHELNRVEIIKGQKSKKRPLAAAQPCREQIGEGLSLLDEGKWVRTNDFFDFLIASDLNYEVARNPWVLYIGHQEYGSLGYSHIMWSHINGRFGRVLLLEYAATLGLIDVVLVPPWGAATDLGDTWGMWDGYSCLSRYDGLWAIRLNSLGTWILEKSEKYTPTFHDENSFRVMPNLEIISMTVESTSADSLFLDRFCEKVSERVWRLDKSKLLQSVEEGISLKQVIDFLKECNDGDLPSNVLIFLEDINGRVDKVKDLGEARLVECIDSHIALLISHDPHLKDLCIQAGERYLVVPKDNEQKFRKALRDLGYVLGFR